MFPPTSSASSLHRSVRLSAVAAAAIAFLVGCSPTPSPTPTPTAIFASQDEAFAAAEQTYQDYNDALNNVDLTNPKTFDTVFSYTTGEFEATDRENLSAMHAKHLEITGANRVVGFLGLRVDEKDERVEARVCVDVSEVNIVDRSGASYVDPDRADVYVIDVTFVVEHDELVIQTASNSGASSCG